VKLWGKPVSGCHKRWYAKWRDWERATDFWGEQGVVRGEGRKDRKGRREEREETFVLKSSRCNVCLGLVSLGHKDNILSPTLLFPRDPESWKLLLGPATPLPRHVTELFFAGVQTTNVQVQEGFWEKIYFNRRS
jgi:hypothetical protein